MDTLRKPLFFVALALIVVALLVEISQAAIMKPTSGLDVPTPGMGIRYLALIDTLLVLTVGLMGTALLVPERVQGRVQGCATALVSCLTCLGGIGLFFMALALLILMVALLFAVPFGTAAYMAKFSHFPTGTASATLGLLMTLKLAFAVCLVLSHQRFLKMKGLMLLVLTSIVATFVVQFLHAFVPRFLASITDSIGAIIVAVVAVIWALFLLVGSLISILKILRLDRAFKGSS